MRELGFDHSADFVYLAHRFYVATNERGICADERVHMLHSMHKFLVKDLSFSGLPTQSSSWQIHKRHALPDLLGHSAYLLQQDTIVSPGIWEMLQPT